MIEYFCIKSTRLNDNDISLQIIFPINDLLLKRNKKETELSVRIQFVDFSFVSF